MPFDIGGFIYNGDRIENDARAGIVTNGLVLHLDAGIPESYPRSGTTWYDLSGNGNDGTLTNGVSYNSEIGGLFNFDGSDDTVTIPNPLNQSNLQQEWTVIGWVNVNNINTTQHLISGMNSGLRLNHATTGRPLLYLNAGADDYYIYGNGNTILGEGWLQVVFLFRNSDGLRKIYVNSSDISDFGPNKTSTPSGLNSSFNIGGSGDLNGKLSVLQMYNRSLSATEITQNFDAQRARFGI